MLFLICDFHISVFRLLLLASENKLCMFLIFYNFFFFDQGDGLSQKNVTYALENTYLSEWLIKVGVFNKYHLGPIV